MSVICRYAQRRCTQYSILATVLFSPLFKRERNIEYTGYGNAEHRDLKAKALSYLSSCLDKLEKRCEGACFAL